MKECDVVKDLLPLYFDEVASEGSRVMVEAHIKGCARCAEELAQFRDNGKTAVCEMNNIEIGAFQKMRRKIVRKTLLTTFTAVFCAILFLWAVYTWQMPTPYDAGSIIAYPPDSIQTVTTMAGNEDATGKGDVFWGAGPEPLNDVLVLDIYHPYSTLAFMQIDDALFINCRNTLYARIFRQSSSKQKNGSISIRYLSDIDSATLLWLGSPDGNIYESGRYEAGDAINRVYYLNASYSRLLRLSSGDGADGGDALAKAMKKAVLVWERVSH